MAPRLWLSGGPAARDLSSPKTWYHPAMMRDEPPMVGPAEVSEVHRTAEAGSSRTATRRLAAGMYLDRQLMRGAIEEIYNARKRRAAPAYGYFLSPVLRHAWRAWWIDLTRDLATVASIAFVLLHAPVALVLVLTVAGLPILAAELKSVVAKLVSHLLRKDGYHQLHGLLSHLKLVCGAMALLLALLVICVLLMSVPVRPRLLAGGPEDVATLASVFVLIGLICASVRISQLIRLRGSASAAVSPRSPRMRHLEKQTHEDVIIYSNSMPFLGAGQGILSWSITQRLIPANRNGQADVRFVRPFDVDALVRTVEQSLEELAHDEDPQTALPGLDVREQIYVEDRGLNEPGQHLDLARVRLTPYLLTRQQLARRYLACQVVAWGGEVVTTTFVNISLQGRTLYVHFETRALLPLPEEFRIMDRHSLLCLPANTRIIVCEWQEIFHVLATMRRIATAPRILMKALMAQRKDPDWGLLRGAHGPLVCIREAPIRDQKRPVRALGHRREKTAGDARELPLSNFQLLDVVRHSKIVERRLFATIRDFLEEHDLDVTEFDQQARAIIDQSVNITSDSGITISGSAIGKDATVTGAASTAGDAGGAANTGGGSGHERRG